jgi:hypothetical protein
MNRRRLLFSMGLALASFAAPQIAFAQSDLDQAISETQKALQYGDEAHHASSFVQHVDNAIDHAMMSQKAQPNAHVKKAIQYLRRGRKIAYDTHWTSRLRKGAAQADKALKQLQAAAQ